MAEVTAIYTYASATLENGRRLLGGENPLHKFEWYGSGHLQIAVPKTSGVIPPYAYLAGYTVEFDYTFEINGTKWGYVQVLAGPGGPGCWTLIKLDGSQSNSGHISVNGSPSYMYWGGGVKGVLSLIAGLQYAPPADVEFNVRLVVSNLVVTSQVRTRDVPSDPPKPPPGPLPPPQPPQPPPPPGPPPETPPEPPPPSGDLPFYALEVLNKPTLPSGGSIAGNIEQVWSPSGNRDTTGVSVFKIEIVTPAAQDTPIAVAFAVVGGSSAKTKTATMVGGVAAFNEALNTALAAGEYRYRIECTGNCIVNKAVLRSPIFYYKGSGLTTGLYLEFTTQPPNDATVGTPMPNIVVKSVNDAGAVQTAASGMCTVVNYSFAGPNKDTELQGIKAVPFVSGVATYTGLIHVINGRYFLKVNAPQGHRENWSEVTNVSGEAPNTPGLRQMHSEDATWRITTGLTAPTFTTPTYDQLQILDGDFAVNAKVTGEGIRDVFIKPMFLRKISVKYKISSLAALPTIKLYTSTDATTPISGTWTLLATVTPNSTKVEIRAYVPSSAVYTTGLWVTLDKNGGSATCDWYSVQVVGDYVKPDFSITTLNTGEVDEEYISIPSPMKNLQGAQRVTRDVIITNNTATDYATVVQAVPARYGGDSKITGEISVREPTTGAMIYTKAFPAGAGQVLRLRYEITKPDNDLSGLHYIKLKIKEYELGMSNFWAQVSSSRDWLLGNLGTGTQITTVFVNVSWESGGAAIGTHDPYAYLIETIALTQTFIVHRVLATTGANVGTFTITGVGLAHNLPYIFNDQMWLLPFSVTGIQGWLVPNVSTVANDTVIDGTTLTRLSMSPQYFEATNAYTVIDPGAPTWVSLRNPITFNGWGGQLVSHSPDPGAHGRVWAVDVAHRTHANFGAVLSRAYCFDYATGRIWRFRIAAGGLIGVESYLTPGGTDAAPREADIYITIAAGAKVNAQQCFIRGTKIYVVFDRRYLYSYDLPTMANETLVWDHGSSWIDPVPDLAIFEF